MAESPSVNVQLLGTYRIDVDGTEIRAGLRAKARELLAFYLLHPAGTTLDAAVEALWPEADPGRGSEWFWTAPGKPPEPPARRHGAEEAEGHRARRRPLPRRAAVRRRPVAARAGVERGGGRRRRLRAGRGLRPGGPDLHRRPAGRRRLGVGRDAPRGPAPAGARRAGVAGRHPLGLRRRPRLVAGPPTGGGGRPLRRADLPAHHAAPVQAGPARRRRRHLPPAPGPPGRDRPRAHARDARSSTPSSTPA